MDYAFATRVALMNVSVKIRRGYELLKKGRTDEALNFFEQLRSEQPKDARIWLHSAFVLDRLGRESEAIPIYERAFALGLHGVDARDAVVCLASSLRNVGRVEEGLQHLEQARRRYRNDVVIELFTALLLKDVGQSEKAVSVLALALLRESGAEDLSRYRALLRKRFR